LNASEEKVPPSYIQQKGSQEFYRIAPQRSGKRQDQEPQQGSPSGCEGRKKGAKVPKKR